MFKRKKGKKASSEGLFEQDVFVSPDKTKRRQTREKPREEPFPESNLTDEYDVEPSTSSSQPEAPYRREERSNAPWKKDVRKPRHREEPRYEEESYDYQQEPPGQYKRSKQTVAKKPLYVKNQPPVQETPEEKAELSEYFEAHQKQSKKLRKKPKTTPPKQSKLSKKEAKRQLEMDLYEGRAFQFRGEIFRSIEDFIDFLHKNYLQLDKIAKEVFETEKFYEWVKKHSDNFEASLVVFQELQQKIENS